MSSWEQALELAFGWIPSKLLAALLLLTIGTKLFKPLFTTLTLLWLYAIGSQSTSHNRPPDRYTRTNVRAHLIKQVHQSLIVSSLKDVVSSTPVASTKPLWTRGLARLHLGRAEDQAYWISQSLDFPGSKPESTDWPLVSAWWAGWWRVGVGRGVSRRVWCVGACRVGVGVGVGVGLGWWRWGVCWGCRSPGRAFI